jgi:uncharacterized membrane protein
MTVLDGHSAMDGLPIILAAFLPISELLGAVPVGYAVGLHPAAICVCVLLGNCAPIVVVRACLAPVRRCGPVARWLARIQHSRCSGYIRRRGDWFVLAATPLTGVWFMTAATLLVGMNGRRTTGAMIASIAAYTAIYAVAVARGIRLWT